MWPRPQLQLIYVGVAEASYGLDSHGRGLGHDLDCHEHGLGQNLIRQLRGLDLNLDSHGHDLTHDLCAGKYVL